MECRPKTTHEMILIHGFAKVTNDPILQSARPDVAIGVGRHEDRRNRMPYFDEVSMEFESGHRGHMKVSDQAGSWLMPSLKLRKLSAEVPPSQCASALGCAARVT